MAHQISLARNIPAEIIQLAATRQLGTPVEVYKPGFPIFPFIASMISVLSGLLFLIFTIFAILNGIWIAMVVLFLLALFGIIFGLIWPITVFNNRTLRVYVCTHGLMLVKNGKTDVIRWDQIETVLQEVTNKSVKSIPVGTDHYYTIRRVDGTVFIFGNTIRSNTLRKAGLLGATIVRESARYLLPKAAATYNAGNPVTFGKLSISQQGVGFGNDVLLWDQVKSIQKKEGIVSIMKEGDKKNKLKAWVGIKAETVPNLFVFMTLVDTIIKNKRQGTFS